MNDLERQLSEQPLRTPPPHWRVEILAAAAKITAPDWTWRDWMWPSPKAWAALAAVWVVVLALDTPPRPALAAQTPRAPGQTLPDSRALYAFAPGRDLDALLEQLTP